MSSSSSSKPFEVAIVGGGVCGLTCAIALAKRGIRSQIYEAAARFTEIGAGIGLDENSMALLAQLGVLPDVIKHAGITQEQFERAKVDPGWLKFYHGAEGHEFLHDYNTPGFGARIGLHRAGFLDALVGHIDQSTAHFNKRCVSVTPSDKGSHKWKISFADGTDAYADIVFGADGVKSTVRGAVTGKDPAESLCFSNTICYRGLVTLKEAQEAGMKGDYSTRPHCFTGNNKHVVTFGISGYTLINVAALTSRYDIAIGDVRLPPDEPTTGRVSADALLKEYSDFGIEVTAPMSCLKDPGKWVINVVHPPLETYVKGGVALLGDAAHCMLPHLGAGAVQGIEDAELLGRLLGHPQTTLDNVEEVLQVYSDIRRPRVNAVFDASYEAGKIYDGAGKSGPSIEGLRKDIIGLWDFMKGYSFDKDVERAVEILHERGVFVASESA